jgi:hypothetical protein
MTQYFFKQIEPGHIQISKFEEGDSAPKDVYDNKHGRCSCPAAFNRKRYNANGCKHDRMKNEWLLLKDKEHYYFDDRTQKFERHNIAGE